MRRREALAGVAANLMIVSPATASGSQANSAIAVGIIGTGNRGRYDAAIVAKDPRARIAALCDLYPDQIDRAKTVVRIQGQSTAEIKGARGDDAIYFRRDFDTVAIGRDIDTRIPIPDGRDRQRTALA